MPEPNPVPGRFKYIMLSKDIKSILLIRPAPADEIFGDDSFLPLGLAYIAAVLEKQNYEVKLLDLIVLPLSNGEFLEELERFNPDIVGFTSVTSTIRSAYRLAALVKEKNPETVTIIGGPHATAMPDECLRESIDFVVKGEGEETIKDLLANLESPEKVNGIAFKSKGRTVHTVPRAFIRDLDALPMPARHLFPQLRLYKGQEALGNRIPVGSIITSRGCPFKCAFCFKAVFGDKFRARSAESVVEEWAYLVKKYKVKEISIVDDSFTTSKKRVHAVCDYLIENKLTIPWSCPNGIRVDLMDPELAQKMRRAGCYRVALGIESGSQAIIDSIGKNITLKQIENAVKCCKKAGIKTMGFFMLGNLAENEDTMRKTINFAIKLNTTYAQFLIALPFPGSRLYNEVIKNGKLHIDNWDQYGNYEKLASFEYKQITPALLLKMHKEAYRRYYFRPGYVVRQLFNLDNYRYILRRIKAFINVFKVK